MCLKKCYMKVIVIHLVNIFSEINNSLLPVHYTILKELDKY